MQYIRGTIILNVKKTGNVKYFNLPKTIKFFLCSFESSSRNRWSSDQRHPTEACNEHDLENGKIIDDITLKITREAYTLNF